MRKINSCLGWIKAQFFFTIFINEFFYIEMEVTIEENVTKIKVK